jgi:hypothetical protein
MLATFGYRTGHGLNPRRPHSLPVSSTPKQSGDRVNLGRTPRLAMCLWSVGLIALAAIMRNALGRGYPRRRDKSASPTRSTRRSIRPSTPLLLTFRPREKPPTFRLVSPRSASLRAADFRGFPSAWEVLPCSLCSRLSNFRFDMSHRRAPGSVIIKKQIYRSSETIMESTRAAAQL